MIKNACLVLSLAVLAAPLATAQEWSELDTLTFVPVSLNRPLSSTAADAAGGPSSSPVMRAEQSASTVSLTERRSAESAIARIQTALDEIDAYADANGENATGLVPLLMNLADVYRELGDPTDAISTLERAQSIVRRTEGLYTLDQADMIEEIIEIKMDITPNEPAETDESELREIVQRNPGDPRNVEILLNSAERQMEVARHLLIHGLPPEFLINSSVTSVGGANRTLFVQPRTTRSEAASALRQARFGYGSAILEALNTGTADISLLLELESSVIDTYYFELSNPKLRRSRQSHKDIGRLRGGGIRALSAKLENSRNFPGTPEAIASALTELADWHLMFSSFGIAMDTYAEAAATLRAEEDGEARVEAMFSPETPVPLPAFVDDANIYSETGNIEGFIDVEIEINRFGGVRHLNVIGGSANASAAIERRLKRHVYQFRFRPRYVDGEWQRSDRFTLRYEFAYSTT